MFWLVGWWVRFVRCFGIGLVGWVFGGGGGGGCCVLFGLGVVFGGGVWELGSGRFLVGLVGGC